MKDRAIVALDAAAAKSMIELIRSCPSPADENCRCAAHRQYFRI